MWDQIDEKLTDRDGAARSSAPQAQVDNILAGRVWEPENAAKLVSLLSGTDSDHMAGQAGLIDGGINFP